MTLLIIYAVISIFFSFLCSILEAVFLSIPPTFINLKKQEGKKYASTLETLKNDVDQPLIAILTFNTVAHTVGAILVGVEAEKLPYKVEILGMNMVGIVSTVMTLLILITSEIIPKTIGATYWKNLANFTAKGLKILIFPLKWTGILWVLRFTTKIIGKNAHGSVFSREDFSAMAEIGLKEGVFLESESLVIRNLLRFNEVLARDIMTPRSVMHTASEDSTIESFVKKNARRPFSRIPVYKDKPDNITGFVLKDQILEEIIEGNGNKMLSEIKRDILVTKRDLPIPKLFEKFIAQREHIALVVDEYGTVSGLVTSEDVIETLLGLEIMDESDSVPDLQQLARKSWEARAKSFGILDKEFEKKNKPEENEKEE